MNRRGRIEKALGAVADAVAVLDRELPEVASELAQEDWLEVVQTSQGLVNRLTSVQDVAIASAARFEGIYEDDGTVGAVDRGPGRVALDAADLVAPRLGASHHQAQSRVEAAVRLTGRTPVPPEDDERPQRTGLDGLHAAMRAGRLDLYRAGVVADELLEAPAPVADAVVAALEPHLGVEPAPALRRRTRRLLARISPDLLRQRAARARRETGLRRWVAEPGVDAWYGTFPSEASAAAWAAIDQVARSYVTEGVCSTIDQARGKALTDLVLEHSDVRVQLVLTTPAELPPEATPLDGPAAEPVRPHPDAEWGRPKTVAVTTEPELSAASIRPQPAAEPVRRGPAADVLSAGRRSPVSAAGASEDLVQVHGVRPSEPVLVRRAWLERLAADRTTEVTEVRCHPSTGARLDQVGAFSGEGYRPSRRLTALVLARDGHCRFPGCSVAARFCDLDHVRPWPTGPTAAGNLLALCRRHHRIKQAPGWSVRLRPDGIAEWTDPTGAATCTYPVDALDHLVLPADRREVGPPALVPADAPPTLPSVLEEALDHRFDQHDAVRRHRRRSRSEVRELAEALAHHRRRRPAQPSGDPPF